MSDEFRFDVFLSHSSRDRSTVQPLAERLRADGLRVWFEPWQLRPGDSVASKFEEGLEQSRVLVLCVSARARGEWAQLESGTYRFRDPLNRDRRFLLLQFDDTPWLGNFSSFVTLRWTDRSADQVYLKLLSVCRTQVERDRIEDQGVLKPVARKSVGQGVNFELFCCDVNSLGDLALLGVDDNTVRLCDLTTLKTVTLKGHADIVTCVAWGDQNRRALSGSDDNTIRLWDVEKEECLRLLRGHHGAVKSVAFDANARRVLSGSHDTTVRLWNALTGRCVQVYEGHSATVWSVAWGPEHTYALSGSDDRTVRLWDLSTGDCKQILEGHTGGVNCVAFDGTGRRAISGADDRTIRVWDLESGRCIHVFEGHRASVWTVSFNRRLGLLLSGDASGSVRLWDIRQRRGVAVLEAHRGEVKTLRWTPLRGEALSIDSKGGLKIWRVEDRASAGSPSLPSLQTGQMLDQVQYTNAKVLLVGESGAGKTGLSRVLAGEKWRPTDSTVGVWATQWKLPVSTIGGVEREIWLWDFGGQADQRLIHQLYMDETALAVLVFDGQRENLFEALDQWDRDLSRASQNAFSKLLVAGRVDAGGLRVSRKKIEAFARERAFGSKVIETSAKVGTGCQELKDAIIRAIHWEQIPWRSSPVLFKRLKEEIVQLKDRGGVLMRFNELRETLRLRLGGSAANFSDDELKSVIALLAGPGVVWELKFGNWILLQPERINSYGQAVIQTLRQDEQERGCLLEERVLNGDLVYNSSIARLDAEDERFVLLAMHQILIERGLCLREESDKGALLVFPSYYRRERPELEGYPAVLVSYRFTGFLDDIYATLVVRLHHTGPFTQDRLWRYAADFRTLTGKQLGVMLTRLGEGVGELDVYFDPVIPVEEKIIFSKYVHEHLLKNAKDVARLRHYVCPHCGTPAGNREVAMKKLREGKQDIPCIDCDHPSRRIPLWDQMEELFGSEDMKRRVRGLEEQSALVLDSESKERALVGDVISTVALAGQICREFAVSDHGIDMEIEFKSESGDATGKKVYLQLKSGDSYLTRRKDGAEIFRITKERHAEYWQRQAFPVLLLIRNSQGEIRWMEVRDYLRRASQSSQIPVKQIIFEGSRFDVMAVRRWREAALSSLG